MLYLKNPYKSYKHIVAIPIILTVIIPLVIFDLWAEIYHRICFPLYGFPYIKRGDYIKIDRHKLKYLSFWQKYFCVYCGYANGIVNYWVKMAGETERYWCGIKHQNDARFNPPPHHKNFAEYNNEEEFKQKYKQ